MDVYVAGAFRIPVAGTLAATGAIIGPCASSNVAGPVRPEDHYAIQPLDRVDVDELLALIRAKQYFVLHAEHWLGHLGAYREAAPQLHLAVVPATGGERGRTHRAGVRVGAGRTDLLVLWPRESGQPSDLWERFVVECKVLRDSDRKSLAWTVEEGVKQTLGYMKQCGAEEGHLVVMDRRSEERRGGDGAEERRDGGGEADGSGRRQDGRGVVIWML